MKPTRLMKAALPLAAVVALAAPLAADTTWLGAVSNDWSVAGNWDNGLPGTDNGNVVVNPGGTNGDPVVSNTGNNTGGFDLYLSINDVTLTIAETGVLNVGKNMITGQWGDSGLFTVRGTLNVVDTLLLGNGGFDGDMAIDGGTVTIGTLSINSVDPVNGAGIDIIGGEMRMPASAQNLSNVSFWVGRGDIKAYGGAGTVVFDDVSTPGTLILASEPPASVEDWMLID
jgi:hypothetical protein